MKTYNKTTKKLPLPLKPVYFTKQSLIIILILITTLPIGTLSQTAHTGLNKVNSFPSDARVRAMLKGFVPDPRITGAVIGLIEPDGRRRVISYGNSGINGRPLNGESVLEIGSVTKVFTGVLLADMVRRGEVKLTEPVARLLPSNVRVPSRNGKEITLLDLATHTSGLPPNPLNVPDNVEGFNKYAIEQMYEFLSGYELPREPGISYQYSNFVSLLGHALSLRAGKSYETLLKERVLLPLDLKQTAVTLTPEMKRHLTLGHNRFGDPQPYFVPPAFISSGRLLSTANDMLDFAAANLATNKTGIYAALHDSRQPHRPITNSDEFMGLGWGVADRESSAAGLAGGTNGFACYLSVDFKNRRAVVVMTNYYTRGASDNIALAVHLLDPTKPIGQKPSIGHKVLATYRAGGVQAAIKQYRTLRRAAPNNWNFNESELNEVGYWLLGRKSINDAIAIFRLNVEMYPETPNPHDSLGDAFRAAGRLEEAVNSYRKAVALAEAANHPNLAGYRKSLESALKQLNTPK